PSFSITLIFLLPSLNLSLSLPRPRPRPRPRPQPRPQRCYPDDKRALLEIKAYLGGNASILSTWSSQTDCCNKWNGVLCKKIPKTQIHRVNFLEISGYDEIVGTIPSTLEKLPYLETLIFRLLPNLTGPIPPVIGKLTRLQLLFLNWDNLSGPIPHFLSRLTNLGVLSLNDNRFTGSIPAFLGKLPKLQGLDLQENQLIGQIPDTFGLLTKSPSINLFNNKLSGPIPRSLGKVNFEILDLSGNQLTGDASFLFGEDKSNLAHLMLSRNRLSFDFSKVVMPVGVLNSSLLVLELSHNNIYGRLPTWLGLSSQMYSFDQAKDAAKAAAREKGTGLLQLKKRAVPPDSETPSTFKRPRPKPRRLAKKEESQAIESAHPGEDEQAVDKPSLVVDLVSQSKLGGNQTKSTDPLAVIPANVYSQIPAEVARRARSSGGKFYSNVVSTYRASSGSSSYSPRHPKAIVFPIAQEDKGKGAALVEHERIPATPHYTSRERAAICRQVFKVVTQDYVASLPSRTDAQFGAIQDSLLDERLHESYDQGEQAVKDAVKHAWENHMEAYDLAWFQWRLEHSSIVFAAERLRLPPPEFVPSDDEDDAPAS
ncbi:hypothetical protein SOVF_174740, partial [Spinacia oleracea]